MRRSVERRDAARGRPGDTRGQRALQLSLKLAVLELIVWVGLGILQGYLRAESVFLSTLAYAAEHFGELAISIATTAYVVFTYHLLESSEAHRMRSIQPYVTVRWYNSSRPSEHRFPEFDRLAKDIAKWLKSTLDLALDLDTLPATDNRYVIVEISNARDAELAWIDLAVTAEAAIPGQNPWSTRDRFRLEAQRIHKSENLEITVLDLGSIPTKAEVTVSIDTIVYGPAETDIVSDSLTGERTNKTVGVFLVSPPQVDVRQQDR